jgi:hypothetical protein
LLFADKVGQLVLSGGYFQKAIFGENNVALLNHPRIFGFFEDHSLTVV